MAPGLCDLSWSSYFVLDGVLLLWLQAFVTLGGLPTLYWMIGVMANGELVWPQAFVTSGSHPVVASGDLGGLPTLCWKIEVMASGKLLWPQAFVTAGGLPVVVSWFRDLRRS